MSRRGKAGAGQFLRNLWRTIREFLRRLLDAFKHVAAGEKNRQAAGGWAPGSRRCVLCVEPTAPADRCPNHPACVCETCCALHGLCDKDED